MLEAGLEYLYYVGLVVLGVPALAITCALAFGLLLFPWAILFYFFGARR